MKAKLSLLSLAVCAAFGASSAFAQSGTVTFTGTIQPTTCTPIVDGAGTGDGTVIIPPTLVSNLNSAGATAGATNFTIGLHNTCLDDGGSYWAFFSAANGGTGAGGMHASTGRITTDKSNLHLQLRDGTQVIKVAANGAAIPAVGTAPTAGDHGTGILISDGKGASPKTYTVEYYANAALGNSDVGNVNSSVKYNIVWY